MESPDGDDTLLDFDRCFKGSLGLGDSCSEDSIALEPKKKKRKAGAEPLVPETIP